MSHVEVVEAPASDVLVEVTAPLTHRCPFKDEVDEGTITIRWYCVGKTYELHSLAEYLRRWIDSEIAHEEITALIAHELGVVVGITLESVTTTWLTAGMEVRCSTSPTPAPLT